MLAEVRKAKPELNVEIIGINGITYAGFNSLVVSERSLSWLQDTREENVWRKWDVRWRDVRIVDSQGQLQVVYNLTDYDLSNRQYYQDLMQLFLKVAKVVDSDGDRLPDDWELRHFGNLLAQGTDDPDSDGHDNYNEYAFGSGPLNPESGPVIGTRISIKAKKPMLNFTFNRAAGDYFNYAIETSSQMDLPFTPVSRLVTQQRRNFFDGTGTTAAEISVPITVPQEFLKLRVLPPQ